MEQTENKFYPPSASAGPDNAYYLPGCDAVQRSPSYASCLFKIKEVQAGRIHPLHTDCVTPIQNGVCKALGMQQEEALKGQALYYFPRRPPQALHLAPDVAGDFGVRITNLTPQHLIPNDSKPYGKRETTVVKVKPKDPLDLELDGGGFADAINAAMQEEPVIETKTVEKAPTSQVTAVPTLARLPDESPLQYARRAAASRNQP